MDTYIERKLKLRREYYAKPENKKKQREYAREYKQRKKLGLPLITVKQEKERTKEYKKIKPTDEELEVMKKTVKVFVSRLNSLISANRHLTYEEVLGVAYQNLLSILYKIKNSQHFVDNNKKGYIYTYLMLRLRGHYANEWCKEYRMVKFISIDQEHNYKKDGTFHYDIADPVNYMKKLEDREVFLSYINSFRTKLSDLEDKIVMMQIQNNEKISHTEIAKELGLSPKTIDNAKTRIRNKADKFYKTHPFPTF